MSLIIQYCEGCGERIPSDALENGEALLFRDSYYYGECKDRILEEHPELAEQMREDSRGHSDRLARSEERTQSTLMLNSATISAKRGDARTSAKMRRGGGSSGMRPAARGGRSETARRGKPGRGQGGPPVALIAGGVGVAIVVIVLAVVLGSSGKPSTTTPSSSSQVVSSEPASSKDVTSSSDGLDGPGTSLAKLRERLDKVKRDQRSEPVRYRDLLWSLEELLDEATGTSVQSDVQSAFDALARERDRKAQQEFDKLSSKAGLMAQKGDITSALELLKTFNEQLLDPHWQGKLDRERQQIERMRDVASSSSARPPQPPRPVNPPDGKPQIPRTGTQVDLLSEGMIDGRDPRGWKLEGGELKIENGAAGWAIVLMASERRGFREFYLCVEFLITSGRVTMRAPHGFSGTQQPIAAQLRPKNNTWVTQHVLVANGQVHYWRDNDPADKGLTREDPGVDGPISLAAAEAGTTMRIRKAIARVQSFGTAVQQLTFREPLALWQPPVPAATAQDAAVWTPEQLVSKNENSEWTVNDGVITAKVNAGAPGTGKIRRKIPSRYVLRLKYRNLSAEGFALRMHTNDQGGGGSALAFKPEAAFANAQWTEVLLIVDGTRCSLRRRQGNGEWTHTKHGLRRAGSGLVIVLTGGSSAELRDMTIGPYTPPE